MATAPSYPRDVTRVDRIQAAKASIASMTLSNRMEWKTFFFWNALGGICWAISVGLLGYFAGATVEHLLKYVGFGAGVALRPSNRVIIVPSVSPIANDDDARIFRSTSVMSCLWPDGNANRSGFCK